MRRPLIPSAALLRSSLSAPSPSSPAKVPAIRPRAGHGDPHEAIRRHVEVLVSARGVFPGVRHDSPWLGTLGAHSGHSRGPRIYPNSLEVPVPRSAPGVSRIVMRPHLRAMASAAPPSLRSSGSRRAKCRVGPRRNLWSPAPKTFNRRLAVTKEWRTRSRKE